MKICETLEEVKRLCKPMKIYNPNIMDWFIGRIWKNSEGKVFIISEVELEWMSGN